MRKRYFPDGGEPCRPCVHVHICAYRWKLHGTKGPLRPDIEFRLRASGDAYYREGPPCHGDDFLKGEPDG